MQTKKEVVFMSDMTMGAVESRFADIIWDNEPISSTELSHRSEDTLGWKKSTSFTVLRRLCQKGIFKNENGVVTSLVSRSDFYSIQSENFVDETFHGSLPAFLAAFTARKNLTAEEIAELRRMVDEYGGE